MQVITISRAFLAFHQRVIPKQLSFLFQISEFSIPANKDKWAKKQGKTGAALVQGMSDHPRTKVHNIQDSYKHLTNEMAQRLVIKYNQEKKKATGKTILLQWLNKGGKTDDPFFYSSAIACCSADQDYKTALTVLQMYRSTGQPPNLHCYTAAINICGMAKRWNELSQLFAEMKRDGLEPSAITHLVVINAFLKEGQTEALLSYISNIEPKGNEDVIPTIIKVNCIMDYWEAALSVMKKNSHLTNLETELSVLAIVQLAEKGHVEASEALLRVTRQSNLPLRKDELLKSHIAIHQACIKKGEWEKAIGYLKKLENQAPCNNSGFYAMTMSACMKAGQFSQALALLEWMEKKGQFPTDSIWNILTRVDTPGCAEHCELTLKEQLQHLQAVRTHMQRFRKDPPFHHFMNFVQFAKRGKGVYWKEAVEEMHALKEDCFTAQQLLQLYTVVMSVCAEAHRQEEILLFLRKIKHLGFQLCTESYIPIVKIWAAGGNWKEQHTLQALAFAEKKDKAVNTPFWNRLLHACVNEADFSTASLILTEMDFNACKADSVTYRHLLNICHETDRWNEAIEFFKRMKEEGIAPSKYDYNLLIRILFKCKELKLASKYIGEKTQRSVLHR